MQKRDQISELLSRGVAEVIIKKHLEEKLRSGKKLRIKFGIDPTGDLLHIGHAVALRKLREFQNLNHKIIFLIGDFTARIGDPSGRNKERPKLSVEQIQKNLATYTAQAGLILDMKKVEVRYNSEWFNTFSFYDLAQLASHASLNQALQRAELKKRLAQGGDATFNEVLYPVLQGYDSVMLEADVEVGGTDQKFNLLMGRQIQKRYGKNEQDVIMVPLLEGTDGSAKMSKTTDNFIGLTEVPENMYGKVMSIPDTLIPRYFELATDVPMRDANEIGHQMKNGVLNPRDAKMRLAREIVALYHNEKRAREAERVFIKTFQKKEIPDEMPVIKIKKKGWNIVDLLVETKLASSKSDARRLIEQGGVSVDEEIITDAKTAITLSPEGAIIKKGKRYFVRVISA